MLVLNLKQCMNQKTKSKVRDGKKTKTASGLTSTKMNLIVNFKFF